MTKRKSMRVAIIMSVYRSDTLDNIRLSFSSILEQESEVPYIYIFRDGEVNINIQCYLDELSTLDNVYVIQSESNLGLSKALNILIDKVMLNEDVEFIARMDADDIARNKRIKRQVEFLIENPDIDICGTSCREFGASFALEEKHLPITHQELLDFSIVRCPFIHPSVMFRRRVFETGIRYPTDTALTEDMALWFELLVSGFKFANINEVLLDYRLNENTIKRRKGMDKALSEVKIRLYYMFKLKRISFKSILLILSRFAFHLLPDSIMKYAYKNVR
ncbi:glycosyl transferase 2 family protein [Vibrio cholerae]|nr:glycosyl transferase 2 family protein [Vibrio cholerae]